MTKFYKWLANNIYPHLRLAEERARILAAASTQAFAADESLGAKMLGEIKDLETRAIADGAHHKQLIVDLRAELDAALAQVKENATTAIREELMRLQSASERHVACPYCGTSYNLSQHNVPHYTHSITFACLHCKKQFEVRPDLFWKKVSVEMR